MNIRYALAEFIQKLISLILDNAGAGFFVLPLLTMRWIIRVFRWGVSTVKGGPDYDELEQQYWQQRERIRAVPGRAREAVRSFRRRF